MSSASLDSTAFACGMRILCDGHFGTVRYVGPVDGQEGVWLGVEWDDVSRGKHDGSVAGKRYFQVDHPTSASFVRTKKVDVGCDFLHAVEDKYGSYNQSTDENDPAVEPSHDLLVLNMKSNKAIAVDFVGADRVAKTTSNWSTLERLALDRQRVNGINLASNDCRKLPAFTSTRHLLLRGNLISSWSQVADICSILPRLLNLDVSENRLARVDQQQQNGMKTSAFQKIESLVMHRLKYSWDDVASVLTLFPKVSSLGLSFNSISTISLSDILMQQLSENITLLDLVGNHIASWEEVLKFGVLKNLRELHLDECGLTEVYFPDAKPNESTALFSALEHLTIDFNKIENWRSVSELCKLSTLKEVRLRHNPMYHLNGMTPQTARQLVVVRLNQVSMLNGSPITKLERRGAEIDYVNGLAVAWLEAAKAPEKLQEFKAEHPTFEKLMDKFKMRQEIIDRETEIKTPISLFINVGFVKFGSAEIPIVQKVSVNVVIAKLKILAKRVLKLTVPPGSIQLSYQSIKNPKLLVPLDKDSKELSFFSIENGDTIVVQF